MAITLYKKELEDKAFELCKALKARDIEAAFDDGSFRDYLVMITLAGNAGKLSIYYKPSTNTFSLKKKVAGNKTEQIVNEIWDNLNGADCYGKESGIYEAFVDGSFMNGVVGYGAVIYLGNELKAKLSGTIKELEFRQFGGELKSVVETLKWCQNNGVQKLRINYDYEGIEKFVTGKWQPKNALSKYYVDFVKNSKISLMWRHIKSHTGNSKNDEADKLAKNAALQAVE